MALIVDYLSSFWVAKPEIISENLSDWSQNASASSGFLLQPMGSSAPNLGQRSEDACSHFRYIIDSSQSDVGFDAWHAPWNTIEGKFSQFWGHLCFSVQSNAQAPFRFLCEGSVLEIDVASLDAGMGAYGNKQTTSTMEACKFPLMKYRPAKDLVIGNPMPANATYKTFGLVAIRDIKQEVEFEVTLDPIALPGQEVLRLTVRATFDRFSFDVCPKWPSITLGKDLRLHAQLVGVLDQPMGQQQEPLEGHGARTSPVRDDSRRCFGGCLSGFRAHLHW